MKTWSRRKRVGVSFVSGLVILAISLLFGTGLYWLTRSLGLTQSGSIKKQVIKTALNDSELVGAYVKSLSEKACRNEKWGYKLIYDQPLKQIKGSVDEECTQFAVVGIMGNPAMVTITFRNQAKEEIIRQLAASVENAETNSLPQKMFEVTSIWGLRDGKPYQAYVMAQTVEDALLLEYYPADPIGLPAVKNLVKRIEKV